MLYIYGGFPKWGYPQMVYNGNSYKHECFGGTPISGNLHILTYIFLMGILRIHPPTSSPLTAGPSKPPTFKTGCWMRKDGLKPSQVGVYKYCKLCYYGNKLIYIYTYIYNMLIIIYQYNMLFPQRTFIHSLSLSVQICIWLYRLYVYVYMHLIHSWCIGSHNQTILLHWTSSGNTPADSPWPHCLTSISHPTKYIRGFVWGIIDFTTIKKNGHQFINLKVFALSHPFGFVWK